MDALAWRHAHASCSCRPARGSSGARIDADVATVVNEPEPRRTDRRGREGVRPLLVVDAGRDQPDRGRRRRGPLLLGLRGEALPRLRLTARQRQHRPPAPEDHRRDQGAGGSALHDRAADGLGVALAPRPSARGGHARRSLHVVLHELGCGGERERDQARAPLDGTAQDRRALPLVPRRDARLDRAHGRPAALAERARDGRCRADARPVHVPLPRRSPGSVPGLLRRPAPRGDPRVRGRAHGRRRDPRDRDRDERGHPASSRLPAGHPGGLRPARDPPHPRRGDGGLRADGTLVRVRELGRRPGHHHRREGDQLGLRPARRDDHPRAPEGVGARPVLPGRAHVRGSPARVCVRGRLDRGVPGGRRRRERGRGRRVPRRRARERSPRATRRSATCGASGASGASSS